MIKEIMIDKTELERIVLKSMSIADVCRALNIRPNGSNYKVVKLKFSKWNIDISHFTGKGWNTGTNFKPFGKKIPLSEILIIDSTYQNNSNLKKRLVDDGLKMNKCEKCGIDSWENEQISLELHHLNEINTDNRIENLMLLCPNCHSLKHKKNNINTSYLSEYRKKKKKIIDDAKVEKEKKRNSKVCIACGKINKTKNKSFCSTKCYDIYRNNNSAIPEINELVMKMNVCNSICEVGREYGVSDNTIRKWLKKYGIVNKFVRIVKE